VLGPVVAAGSIPRVYLHAARAACASLSLGRATGAFHTAASTPGLPVEGAFWHAARQAKAPVNAIARRTVRATPPSG